MKDLVLVIYDDEDNEIYRQTMFNTFSSVVDEHGTKLCAFFKAKNYTMIAYKGK